MSPTTSAAMSMIIYFVGMVVIGWWAYGRNDSLDDYMLADRGLGNQVPQTRLMVSLARDMGAIGASSFGAGWGGSVYALVRADDAEAFASQWLGAYRDREQGAEQAAVIVTRPGPGACRLL